MTRGGCGGTSGMKATSAAQARRLAPISTEERTGRWQGGGRRSL